MIRLGTSKWSFPAEVPREAITSTYLMGLQGRGKSSCIVNLTEQLADHDAILFVDTVGELSQDFILRTKHRQKVRYIDPATNRWYLPLIQGDFTNHQQQDASAGTILKLFQRMGLANSATTRVNDLVKDALYLSFAFDKPTLGDINDILSDEAFRRALYDSPRLNPLVRKNWLKFDRLTEARRYERSESTISRIEGIIKPYVFQQLTGNTGEPIELRTWLDAGDVVILDLSKLEGDNCTAAASLVMAVVLSLVFARPNKATPIWRIVCDEFHTFTEGRQMSELIAQGRKKAVFPILAHQWLAQLDDDMRSAVKSCEFKMFLQCSPADEHALEKEMDVGAGMSRLPKYHARYRLNELQTVRLDKLSPDTDEAFLKAVQGAQRIVKSDEAHPTHPHPRHPQPLPPEPDPPLARGVTGAGSVSGADPVAGWSATLPQRTKSKTGAAQPRRGEAGGLEPLPP